MDTETRDSHTIATGPHHHVRLRAPHLDRTAISPYDSYCDGYGMPGATGNGYVNILKVSCGTVDKTDDALVDRIVTYDKAECADAYVGQINMLTASSFCGVMGQVWGHDLAAHPDVKAVRLTPLFTATQFNGAPLPVYDAKPVIDAGIELFGTDTDRRYHPAPGAHVICANKGVTAYRPRTDRALADGEGYGVWSFIAISLSNDRDYCADLFIEDAGVWTENDDEAALRAFLDRHRKEIVWSVVECGRDSGVLFERTYVGYAYTMMRPGQIGNAITVGPYVTLARDAVPTAGFARLNDMTIVDWLDEQGFESLTGIR
ncbi:MAG: histidine decarboxylase, pyruvoyl type [Bifidobacterium sp.]|nr:histidine decarboxylase, pyruvoyl type [Bifidobacterium sp.]